ncbi:hypothetical protein [Paraburkholderia sediminicola]|uniref:hypothetical protein n=1 Tax=Paraburkholderia sediminicola TaxID=458836 RepID=UPI0038BA1ACD
MLTKNVIAAVTTSLFLLSGCGSKQDASKGNFQAAIQDYLNTKTGVCVMMPAKEAPFTLQKKGNMDFINAPEKAAALVSAGLLSAKDMDVKSAFGNQMVPGVQYSLTDEGKKYLVKGGAGNVGNWDAFCGGKYKVKEVENFTQPADMFGSKISQVNFLYEVDDAPSWAKQPAIQAAYPSVQHDVTGSPGDKAVLVATNDGWMHERLFKSKGG